jgi:hypothetical protein
MGTVIRLTESQLKSVISRIINESSIEKDPSKKESYPLCVQGFGNPKKGSTGIWGIDGNDSLGYSRDYTGYRFYNNSRVIDSNRNVNSYFCKGTQPVLGDKVGPTKGSKVSSVGMTANNKILRLGSSGFEVKQLQNRLASDPLYGGGQKVGGNPECGKNMEACDGKFGRGTEEAVKQFQTKVSRDSGYSIKSDGIVGDETWQMLFGGKDVEDLKKYKKPASYDSRTQIEKYRERNPGIDTGAKF